MIDMPSLSLEKYSILSLSPFPVVIKHSYLHHSPSQAVFLSLKADFRKSSCELTYWDIKRGEQSNVPRTQNSSKMNVGAGADLSSLVKTQY